MTAVAFQNVLPLALPTRRPLMKMGAVIGALDIGEDEILSLIGNGLIRYAWNIASKADSAKREVRVLASSISEFEEFKKNPKFVFPKRTDEELLSIITDLILPPCNSALASLQMIRGTEMMRALNASQDLIADLIANKELLIHPSYKRSYETQSPFIIRASAVNFLMRRSSFKGGNL